MIHAAHASRYHRGTIVEKVNFTRGDWQIAHVYIIRRHAQPALYHARRCRDQCVTGPIGDFDLVYAHEAVARACACAGQTAEASGTLLAGRRR